MTILTLTHRAELEVDSAIDATIIAERGYRSITQPDDLPPAFADWMPRPSRNFRTNSETPPDCMSERRF